MNHRVQNVCICLGEHCVPWTGAGARGEREVCGLAGQGKDGEGFLLWQLLTLLHLSFTSVSLTSFLWQQELMGEIT